MSSLAAFPITKRWPAQHPDRLQLYSLPTPNGVKVSIMLEEIGLPYEPHTVDFGKNDQQTPEFLSLNPNGKIPAILDPDGPGGKPLGLFESGAILHYLADKTKKLLPTDPARQWETLAWVHFQMGGIGPIFGQVGFFNKFAGKDFEDKRPRDRYVNESKRLLGVLDKRLEGREWIMDKTTPSPMSPRSAGCATWSASMKRKILSALIISSTSRRGLSAASHGPRFSVASPFRSGREPDRQVFVDLMTASSIRCGNLRRM